MDPKYIAQIAHDADRALCAVNRDLTVKGWFALEGWQRENAVRGVKVALATPGATAAELHVSWAHDKRDAGWTHAAVFDLATKRDPHLLPWAQLPDLVRRREALTLGVIRALSTPTQE